MACKGSLLNSVVLKKSVEIDFRLRKLMIFYPFFPYKMHEFDITICSMYTVRMGCLTEDAPHALRLNWHIFHSFSSGTGQINRFQNLTYSSGKKPWSTPERSLSFCPEPCLDKFRFSSHFTACWVCLSVSALATAPGKSTRPSIPEFLHTPLLSLKLWLLGTWSEPPRFCSCLIWHQRFRMWQLGIG